MAGRKKKYAERDDFGKKRRLVSKGPSLEDRLTVNTPSGRKPRARVVKKNVGPHTAELRKKLNRSKATSKVLAQGRVNIARGKRNATNNAKALKSRAGKLYKRFTK